MGRGPARHGLCVLVEPRLEDAGMTRLIDPLSLLVKKQELLASKKEKFGSDDSLRELGLRRNSPWNNHSV
jgi:hypothetical protein